MVFFLKRQVVLIICPACRISTEKTEETIWLRCLLCTPLLTSFNRVWFRNIHWARDFPKPFMQYGLVPAWNISGARLEPSTTILQLGTTQRSPHTKALVGSGCSFPAIFIRKRIFVVHCKIQSLPLFPNTMSRFEAYQHAYLEGTALQKPLQN